MNIDIKTILDELKESPIDEYDIKPLIIKAIRNIFYKQYGIYTEEKNINIIDNIDKSVKDLYNRYIAAYNNLENATIFYQLHNYAYALREINDKFVQLTRYISLSNSSILFIVRYAINGYFDKDYSEINKLLDSHNPRINYDSHQWLIALGKNEINTLNDKVTIKSFKNGKIIITGLTNEQKERLQKGFDIIKKYNNAKV